MIYCEHSTGCLFLLNAQSFFRADSSNRMRYKLQIWHRQSTYLNSNWQSSVAQLSPALSLYAITFKFFLSSSEKSIWSCQKQSSYVQPSAADYLQVSLLVLRNSVFACWVTKSLLRKQTLAEPSISRKPN